MAVIAAAKALYNLILRGEFFCCLTDIVYIEAIRNTFVGSMWIVHVYYDGMVEFYFIIVVVFASRHRLSFCANCVWCLLLLQF